MPDTIAAVSTGNVLSGIGVLRVSGPEALELASRVFVPDRGEPMSRRPDRLLVYGSLLDREGAVIDRCLCFVSRGPHSYTGEDTAELQCHGSPVVLRAGLEALFAAGARQAGPGEFTRRAFLNGRLDLTQAEAVMDLIEAETPEAARNAAGQLGGAVTRRTDGIYDALADISSHFHAVIDYPDEDIEPFRLEAYEATLRKALGDLDRLLQSQERGKLLTAGISAVIAGRPNVGKSTLLNALLGYERAIVTEVPGTTRDTVTERLRLGGLPVRLTDTAGIRETPDAIERLGVTRSREALAGADLVLLLADAAEGLTPEDRALVREVSGSGAPWLFLPNKTDLSGGQAPGLESALPPGGRGPEQIIPVSARTGAGLDRLSGAVAELFPAPEGVPGEILTNPRQAEAVARARTSIAAALEAMEEGIAPDAVLTETELAMEALGELSGRTVREDVTRGIFARFCVGK